jgi:hypothetical protein
MLFEPIQRFREQGGLVEVVVGVDLNGTSVQALRLLTEAADTVRVFQNANRRFRQTYHPKFYLFFGDAAASIIVGSSNLTLGGLFVNVEQNVRLDLDLQNDIDRNVFASFRDGYQSVATAPNGVTRELTDDLLDQLIQRGILEDEDAAPEPRIRSGDQENDESKATTEPLFGRMDVAPPPAAPRRARPARRRPDVAPPTQLRPVQPAPANAATAAVQQPAGARVPEILTMRPYPARGGTQIQVPQTLAASYFQGVGHVLSEHNGRQHPISPARSRGGINTIKLEIPECRLIGVPIMQFRKNNNVITYRVFDGQKTPEGRQLLRTLENGLTSGASHQTRPNSTIWAP